MRDWKYHIENNYTAIYFSPAVHTLLSASRAVTVYQEVCRHGLAWLGCFTTSALHPPGSPEGSDKTGFPDQGRIDSWLPEEEWWAWDSDWGEDLLCLRAPLGPLVPKKYVDHNGADCFIGRGGVTLMTIQLKSSIVSGVTWELNQPFSYTAESDFRWVVKSRPISCCLYINNKNL